LKDKKIILSIVLSSLLVIAFLATNVALSNPVEYISSATSTIVAIELDNVPQTASNTTTQAVNESVSDSNVAHDELKPTDSGVFSVPFFSQFEDISNPQWRKVGCGIASIAMLIEFYEPGEISVDGLLEEGIKQDAYLSDQGWIHSGLISLAEEYGLNGTTNSLAGSSMEEAFATLEKELEKGPVIASVHYTFEPTNPIPHLVVVNGVEGDKVFYNDPSEPQGGGSISIEKFKSSWKKRYISIWPTS
jgi:predicted double-glycine peptidase